MNNKDLHEQWRRVMREAKASELKRDAQAMAEAHRRLVDHKDTTLRKVKRNLDDAEEQHRMALRSHSTLVDRLMDLQRERVRSLEQEFGSSLQRMQREFDQEREQIKSSHERQKEELERLMSAMSDAFNEQLSNARSEFESTREEIKNRNSEEYNVLKHSLEQVIDDLEKQFEQAHQAYRASTDAKMQSFRQLTKSDQKSATTIAARMKKINRLHDSLQHWRKKIAADSREWEECNKALSEERNEMSQHYQNLQAKMNRFREDQAEKLKSLTLNSNACINALQSKLEQAERILQLGGVCTKLETEEERVRPFSLREEAEPSCDSLPEGTREKVEALLREQGIEPSQMQSEVDATRAGSTGESALASWSKEGHTGLSSFGTLSEESAEPLPEEECLTRFYRRYNRAVLDVHMVRAQKEKLEAENSDLRAQLKGHVDGVSVSNPLMSELASPLVTVNSRRQLQRNE